MKVLFVGIAGGRCSGKISFAHKIRNTLGAKNCEIVSEENYYLEGLKKAKDLHNPKSINYQMLKDHLGLLKKGVEVEFTPFQSILLDGQGKTIHTKPVPVILVEGSFIFRKKELRNFFDISVFVECSSKVRLARCLEQDSKHGEMTKENVKNHFKKHMEPMHRQFILPTMAHAKFFINGEDESSERVNYIVRMIKEKLPELM